MAPEKPPPLPVATNRAALLNQFSLLSSSRAAAIKSRSLLSRPQTQTKHHERPEEDDLYRESARPANAGVGYVPDAAKSKVDEKSKEDRFLRGKLLGKGGLKGGKGGRRPVQEEEEDDDPGRSSLGKRKRGRREIVQEEGLEDSMPSATPEASTGEQAEEGTTATIQADAVTGSATAAEAPTAPEAEPPSKKKKKRKNKKKQGGGE